jgi:cold shock CspA family protein
MLFKLPGHNPEMFLPRGRETDRWVAAAPRRMEEIVGDRWDWWVDEIASRADSRTTLTLGWDRHVRLGEEKIPRAVVLRTVNYRHEDRADEESIRRRRRILEAQVELLNQLASPLVPEPLDWFEVRNEIDAFPSACAENEPVLVLDWQVGQNLEMLLRLKKFESKRFRGQADVARIARVGRAIVGYLRLLSEHRIVCFDLNPSHVLLRDTVPRFLGLGALCPILDTGEVDVEHPNFLHTTAGYFPPEINNPAHDWDAARSATTESVGAFALGVLLLQMACGVARIPQEWLLRGTVAYPGPVQSRNEHAEALLKDRLHRGDLEKLIRNLCAFRRDERLTDLDEIDEELASIAGDLDAETRAQRREARLRLEREKHIWHRGRVQSYDPRRGYGQLSPDDEQFGAALIRRSVLVQAGIHRLFRGQRVTFQVELRANSPVATRVQLYDDGGGRRPRRKDGPKPEPTEKRRFEEILRSVRSLES